MELYTLPGGDLGVAIMDVSRLLRRASQMLAAEVLETLDAGGQVRPGVVACVEFLAKWADAFDQDAVDIKIRHDGSRAVPCRTGWPPPEPPP